MILEERKTQKELGYQWVEQEGWLQTDYPITQRSNISQWRLFGGVHILSTVKSVKSSEVWVTIHLIGVSINALISRVGTEALRAFEYMVSHWYIPNVILVDF